MADWKIVSSCLLSYCEAFLKRLNFCFIWRLDCCKDQKEISLNEKFKYLFPEQWCPVEITCFEWPTSHEQSQYMDLIGTRKKIFVSLFPSSKAVLLTLVCFFFMGRLMSWENAAITFHNPQVFGFYWVIIFILCLSILLLEA